MNANTLHYEIDELILSGFGNEEEIPFVFYGWNCNTN